MLGDAKGGRFSVFEVVPFVVPFWHSNDDLKRNQTKKNIVFEHGGSGPDISWKSRDCIKDLINL